MLNATGQLLSASSYIRHVLKTERNSLGRTELPPFWNMLRESRKYFLLVTLAAFALRIFFYLRFPHVTGDSLVYGDIAKNWLQHGIYGLDHAEWPSPLRYWEASITTPSCWCRSPSTWRAVSSSPTWGAERCRRKRRGSHFFWLRCVPLPPTIPWLRWLRR